MKFNYGILVAATLSAGVSFGKTCEVKVDGTDAMSYSTKSLSFAGCTDVKLTLTHTGKLPKAAMGHNLVIAAESDVKNIITEATKAGPAKDYAPGSKNVIATTKLLGGGETDTITFPVAKFKKGTKYKFFCTFPGHSAVMTGAITL